MPRSLLLLLLPCFSLGLSAQNMSSRPSLEYSVKIDSADLSYISIEMKVHSVPAVFHLAMMAHPEYDDRYWRFIENLKFQKSEGVIERKDSSLWQVKTKSKNVCFTYRIHLPVLSGGLHPSWQAYLTRNGGLAGGPDIFLYVPEKQKLSSTIKIQLPGGWKSYCGLKQIQKEVYFASKIQELVDAPILVGKPKEWIFYVRGVPHHVLYLPQSNPIGFDTTLLVTDIKKIVQQAISVFGSFPYKRYYFFLQDQTYGALEHFSSVSIGAPNEQVGKDIREILSEVAHEFFHTWNLVYIRPAEYGDVTYKDPPLAKELWFSEGFTMYYADILLRRAHLPTYDSTRILHVSSLLSAYFTNSGNQLISPDKVSLASNAEPGMLGNYSASTHTQGQLLAFILDLEIRNSTKNLYSLDNVMRIMNQQYGGNKGFTDENVERIITSLCSCLLPAFFQNYIHGNKKLDINAFLYLIGYKMDLTWKEELDNNNLPAPDLRIYAWKAKSGGIRIRISDPASCWARAGLNTGDELISINGRTVATQREFFTIVRNLRIADSIFLLVKRSNAKIKTEIQISGVLKPVVRITKLDKVSMKQNELFKHWSEVD